ncbi:MAG: rod shape-determining protein [Candidatus Nealsonbacteria bacterium]|nr:rod shape-determining protein [Candidatus Nealsonbacteria bacterium]
MFLVRKIGIDLGTCNSVVFVPPKGVILQEPSVVAVSLLENRILAVGREAKEMLGKTPDTLKVYRPLKDGVIADFRVTQAMLKYFIDRTSRMARFFKPELIIGVPAGVTSTERRAVVEAGNNAGAKGVYVAKEPILAAIGAGIPIGTSSGHMIVDIGGGTAEMAVISLGGIVNWGSIRLAGDKIDEAIANYIKEKHNLAIGEQTAEEIKINIATALPEKEEKIMQIRGRDLILGLPKTVKISSNEVCAAISDVLMEIIQTIKQVLRETPPELSADVIDKGIVLSGGGALLRNFDQLIERSIGVPCLVADEPLLCVARGTGVVAENLEVYKKSLMTKK